MIWVSKARVNIKESNVDIPRQFCVLLMLIPHRNRSLSPAHPNCLYNDRPCENRKKSQSHATLLSGKSGEYPRNLSMPNLYPVKFSQSRTRFF